MHRFFGRPDKAGVLTIINGLLWVAIAYWLPTDNPSDAVLVTILILAVILSLPLAGPIFFFHLFYTDENTRRGVVASCVIIGVNCFLWGYGPFWLVRWHRMRKNLPRGFNVIFSSPKTEPTEKTSPNSKQNI